MYPVNSLDNQQTHIKEKFIIKNKFSLRLLQFADYLIYIFPLDIKNKYHQKINEKHSLDFECVQQWTELSDGNDKNRIVDTQVHTACAGECTHQHSLHSPPLTRKSVLRSQSLHLFSRVYLVGCLCQSSIKKYKPSCVPLFVLKLSVSLWLSIGF